MPLTGDIKGKIKTRKLKNTADAAKTVAEWLKKQSSELNEVHIIMEATGVYHEPLAYGLHFAGAQIITAPGSPLMLAPPDT
ncbi:putative invertase [Escherichia coli]|nr:putative invertase [Escherichia coli]CTZ14802.1 putative invertase [Escherichia coli]CTZ71883.1 putative invertase [Escherichia coli]